MESPITLENQWCLPVHAATLLPWLATAPGDCCIDLGHEGCSILAVMLTEMMSFQSCPHFLGSEEQEMAVDPAGKPPALQVLDALDVSLS